MESNEPFSSQALGRAGTRWLWGSHDFVDHVTHGWKLVSPLPGSLSPILSSSTTQAEHWSEWTPIGDAERHSPEPLCRTGVLLLPDPSRGDCCELPVDSSPGLAFAWRHPVHPKSCLLSKGSSHLMVGDAGQLWRVLPAPEVLVGPANALSWRHHSSLSPYPTLFVLLSHKYWCSRYLVHTNVSLRPVS